jgi:hypothetical protein
LRTFRWYTDIIPIHIPIIPWNMNVNVFVLQVISILQFFLCLLFCPHFFCEVLSLHSVVLTITGFLKTVSPVNSEGLAIK